jgi:hypothetical protein
MNHSKANLNKFVKQTAKKIQYWFQFIATVIHETHLQDLLGFAYLHGYGQCPLAHLRMGLSLSNLK